MNRLVVTALAFLVVASSTSGQDVYPRGRKPTPTEVVVQKYAELIVQGALLTPEGWQKAGRLFTDSKPYPAYGKIELLSPRIVGEDWVKGENAQVETKWGNYDGSIDSSLRYIQPTYPVSMGGLLLKLQFVHQQRTTTSNGATASKIVAPPVWKIEGALGYRSASVQAAIVYVAKKRDETTDPVIRQNAEKTLGILKRMLHRGPSGSAC